MMVRQIEKMVRNFEKVDRETRDEREKGKRKGEEGGREVTPSYVWGRERRPLTTLK